MQILDDKTANLFWEKVRRTPDGCWTWLGATHGNGYGTFYLGRSVKRMTGAHRAALLLSGTDIPEDLNVCHKCDNKGCVRPSHLFIGSQRENIADMLSKKRHWMQVDKTRALRGERQGRAKLKDGQVRDIRKRYADGEVQMNLAREFGVSHTLIRFIVKRKLWSHI